MKFSCPKCEVHLQAEVDMAGKAVKCPGCGTKIQIPASIAEQTPKVDEKPNIAPITPSAPDAPTEEPSGLVPEQSRSTGEELAGSIHDDLPDLEMSQGPQGPHPSQVNIWIALGYGLTGVVLWYLVMGMLPEKTGDTYTAGSYLRELFCERGWPQYVTSFLMFWCLALLIMKGINIQKQRRAMLIEALPSDISDEINIHNLPEFHEHLVNFPKLLRNTYIVNRIRKALEFFYIRQNNPEVAQMLASQSEIDANKVAGGYSLVKVFLWAIPIMGFIGTVIGIGGAIGGFGAVLGGEAGDMEAIKEPLMNVLDQLGVAFDTTLLALVFSILLSFPASSLQNSEEDLVTDIDEYCIDNLLRRLNDGGAGSNAGGDAGLLKAIGEAMATSQTDMLKKFSQVQDGMSSSLDNQQKYFKEVAGAIDTQLDAIGKRAETYEKKLDDDFFGTLEKVEKGSIKAIENNVKPLAEGIQNLNKVLKELNGKQVVIQKKGWFSRG